MNADKDGIWKDAVEQCLPLILKRMIPDLYDATDFSQQPKFLDKELRDTIQVSLSGEHNAAKFVDTLVQLQLRTGAEQWVLLHIEVQGKGGDDISYRMFLYCCLIFAHYGRMPVALAILTDKRPAAETPGKFTYSQYGTELNYKYNLFEVYNQSDEQLLNSDNPFDVFIYAAKKYKDYMDSSKQKVKLEYLLKITRNLYARGLGARERTGILMLVNRIINLEDIDLRKQYFNTVEDLKGDNTMRELHWFEQYVYDKAVEEIRAEGEARARNAAIEFMRSNGMTDEQIDSFNKLFVQADK